MARITKKSAQAATTKATKATKVARVRKAKAASGQQAKATKGTKAKAATASGQQARGRRSQYAGMRIKNVAASETPCRGGAAIRFDTIVAHKNVDDAIGAEYIENGETKVINSADIAYLVKRELIELS